MQNSWDAQVAGAAGGSDARPAAGAPEIEAGDDQEGVLLDEMAEKLRRAGCPAAMAPHYVEAVLGVLKAKDATLSAEARKAEDAQRFAVERLEMTFREQLRKIEAAERPKLQARVFLIARGVEVEHEDSIRKVAATWNLSPEGVRKMVNKARAQLGLPKNQFNKSEAASEAYRRGNRRNYKHGDATGN